MPYMNKRQIVKAYNDGLLDDVKKQLCTYGTIVLVKDWETEEGYYKGASRIYRIEHHGLQWKVYMLNGEVLEVSHTIGGHKFW